MDELNEENQLKRLVISHGKLFLIVIIALLAVAAVIFFKGKSKGVVGNYASVSYEDKNYNTKFKLEKSFFNVAGVDDKAKKSELYLHIADDCTGRLEGYVYLMEKYKDYQKYRFNITKQTGTLFGKMNFIYFEYYPGRGDNGLIEVTGDGVVIDFSR